MHLIRCDGSWGLAAISTKNPDEIVVACNGSPMVHCFYISCIFIYYAISRAKYHQLVIYKYSIDFDFYRITFHFSN